MAWTSATTSERAGDCAGNSRKAARNRLGSASWRPRFSSWIAARILPSSHTNPVFALVGGQPVRASRRSAEWALDAVNQCWSQKAGRIKASELEGARKAYDHARAVYRRLIAESR